MPRNIKVTFSDGSTHTYKDAPDNITPDDVQARAEKDFGKAVMSLDGGAKSAQPQVSKQPSKAESRPSIGDAIKEKAAQFGVGLATGGPVGAVTAMLGEDGQRQAVEGALTGAATIGNTVLSGIRKVPGSPLWLLDKAAPKQTTVKTLVTGKQSRPDNVAGDVASYLDSVPAAIKASDEANKDSLLYKGSKLGAQVAMTAPVGGAIAEGASAIPLLARNAPNLINAIRSGGMVAGQPAPGVLPAATNMITRMTGGAITGGASAGLIDPEQAGGAALVGGAIPLAVTVAGKAGNMISQGISSASNAASKRLMQSAIKPTIKQLKSGDAETAVNTLLEYGINPTEKGVNKIRTLIDEKNAAIADAIANSGATVDKSKVLSSLAQVRQKFGNQVSPTGDLNAIENVANDFALHPSLPTNDIPVQVAQNMKQGTYQILRGKYGQVGSAETEAQKSLARGLKEEIAAAVPEVAPLNAEESKLLTTLSVAERRALMEMNKNPMGLAALANNPTSWAMFMADKSALFKALAARAVNSIGAAPNAIKALSGPSSVQRLAYQAAPVLAADR